MSRTLRTNTQDSYKKTSYRQRGIKTLKFGEHYLTPYSRRNYKFVVDNGLGTGVSKTGKLVTRNANRSLKKTIRQQGKRESTILD